MRKPPIIKKYEKTIGEIEDWDKKSKKKREALIKYAEHLDQYGQLDEIMRRQK